MKDKIRFIGKVSREKKGKKGKPDSLKVYIPQSANLLGLKAGDKVVIEIRKV